MKKYMLNTRRMRVFTLFFSFIMACSACKKTGEEVNAGAGAAKVNVHLLGVELDDIGSLGSTKSSAAGLSKAAGRQLQEQTVTVPFDDDYAIEATLIPNYNPDDDAINSKNNAGNLSARASVSSSSANKAEIIRTPLAPGTYYKMLVYDASGKFIVQKDYRTDLPNPDGEAGPLELDGGTYTFIFYASQTLGKEPNVDESLTLDEIKLTSLSSSLLITYVSKVATVTEGENNLDIVMKFIYTGVTLEVDASELDQDITVLNASMANYDGVSLQLKTGEILHSEGTSQERNFSFPAGLPSAQVKSSYETQFCVPSTSNGILKINKIGLGQSYAASYRERLDIAIPGLSIIPGQRYKLIVKIRENLNFGTIQWAPGNLRYDEATDSYSFVSRTSLGSYFADGRLYPVSNTDMTMDDPCTKVDGGWRTPTRNELLQLSNLSTQGAQKYAYRSSSGGQENAGAWFDNRLFLPAGGYIAGTLMYNTEGWYLGKQQSHLYFYFDYASTANSIDEMVTNGYQLRCVKNN